MKRVVVMAFEDRSRPEGGHATLLIRDVTQQPEPATFALRLIGAADGDAMSGTFGDRLEPVSTRLTSEGLELTVGPDIVEAPELAAGTAVELTVPSLGVRGEFLWPDVAPRARPKRRLRVGRAPSREAVLPGGSSLGIAVPDPASFDVSRIPVLGAAPAPVELDRGTGGAAAPEIADATPLVPARPAVGTPRSTAVPAESRQRGESRPAHGAMQAPVASAQPSRLSPAEVSTTSVPAENAARPRARGSRLGFAAAIVAGVLLAEVAIWLAAGERLQQWLGVMVIGAKVSQPAPPAPAPALPGGSPVDLYDLLVPGARSPSGIDAAGVSADRALALASESLQGSERRNTVEGAFWLRRYLAERIGSPVTARALTQLGSALAEPSAGAPDYARAHRAWQMAAAYGDPVAMCFLAALHASGLGVPADKAAAERWQAAAQAAGGCAGSGKP